MHWIPIIYGSILTGQVDNERGSDYLYRWSNVRVNKLLHSNQGSRRGQGSILLCLLGLGFKGMQLPAISDTTLA